jgi:hypothetical protein
MPQIAQNILNITNGDGNLEEITQRFKARDAQLASFEQYHAPFSH